MVVQFRDGQLIEVYAAWPPRIKLQAGDIITQRKHWYVISSWQSPIALNPSEVLPIYEQMLESINLISPT